MGESRRGIGLPVQDLEWAGDVEGQLRRILDSPVLRNSPLLQSFLRFITEYALHGRGDEINEYSIATQVFARNSDFDPAGDTIVRTQAYRLRSKLQQYYSTIGAIDPVIIEIPKGHYVPMFRRSDLERTGPAVVVTDEPAMERRARPAPWWKFAVSGAILLSIFLAGWFAGSRTRAAARAHTAASGPRSPVEAFWAAFLETDSQPIVAFTNGQFLGTESGDLLRFPGGPVADRGTLMVNPPGNIKHSGRLYYEDDYTGVGEVLAAVAISNTLSASKGPLMFKRSRLVTTYDLQHHNVIFLGSPAVNPILNELRQNQNFIYRSARTPLLLWKSQFENVHPLSGESPSYQLERNPQTGALQADYATISLFSGIAPGRKVLVLAGLTTSGTQGAAEGVTTLQGVTELAAKLDVRNPADPEAWPATFQALLRVELSRGLDVIQSHPVASRIVKMKN
jgi:hypothetical protein